MMKRQQWGLYAVALSIVVVGLVWAGVPAATLLFAGVILVCPLMMMVMMRSMHGAPTDGDQRHASSTHGHCDGDAADDRATQRSANGTGNTGTTERTRAS